MSIQEFIDFYKPLLNFSNEEWSLFFDTIKTQLPSSFRVTNTKFKNKILEKILSNGKIQKNIFFENVFDTLHRGPYLKEFIINQTNIGNIQRQEVVSMLPVLLMNLKKHHTVFDMCAAPGSKTKQLLETASLVVANDCNNKRLNVLVTETCKIPHKSFLAIKHDASSLPIFKNDFDRVLCDVPCSGDGTARKNPTILEKWNLKGATGLSNLQLRILKHAFKFVKDHGIVIYSTCSLNPIENECIIYKILEDEECELIDLRDFIDERFSKDFIFRNGMISSDLNKLNPETHSNKLNPETYSNKFDKDLFKCIRVYPHDNNTGGFFITGLRKKSEIKVIKKAAGKNCFKEIEDEIKFKLENDYNIKEKRIVYRNKAINTLYEVSDDIFNIINNSKLNIVHCGYKLFEKCSLSKSGYRMKNISSDFYDVELCGRDVIEKKSTRIKFKKGNVIVKLSEFDILIGGYSHGEKINLYISNNLQKALLDFFD